MNSLPFRLTSRFLLALLVIPAITHAALAWPSTLDNATRIRAVKDTIAATPACRNVGDFYWEMGDANTRLASGRVGYLFDANTVVSLASASKLPFVAYFVQRFGTPNKTQIKQLTMRSGYMFFVDPLCFVQPTLGSCFTAPSSLLPLNNLRDPQEQDRYFYSGGHFQKLAVDAGLGNMTNAALQTDIRKYLGADTGITVQYSGVASGLGMSANGYAVLLRKIIGNRLVISNLMGSNKTCTLPQACAQSSFSPLEPRDWDYSIGHWVEREPDGPDEAYNSIGLFGFYPWITADKKYYGLISTLNLDLENAGPTSMACGQNMRRAWLTGVMQN